MTFLYSEPKSSHTSVKFYAESPQVTNWKSFNAPMPENQAEIDLVTEDDEPVDNIFSEKQQRLLTESLYNSWDGPEDGRSFVTLANVGLFYAEHEQPLVPDVLVSLDVKMPDDVWEKHNRSYFVCEYGKPPEVVIEIVSNLKGKEAGTKLQDYAEAGVHYYVILDPKKQLKKGMLRIYELCDSRYVKRTERWLADVGLGLTLWTGKYEDKHDVWLRWSDRDGNLILTGTEGIQKERQRAEHEHQRAELEYQEKKDAQQRAKAEAEARRAAEAEIARLKALLAEKVL